MNQLRIFRVLVAAQIGLVVLAIAASVRLEKTSPKHCRPTCARSRTPRSPRRTPSSRAAGITLLAAMVVAWIALLRFWRIGPWFYLATTVAGMRAGARHRALGHDRDRDHPRHRVVGDRGRHHRDGVLLGHRGALPREHHDAALTVSRGYLRPPIVQALAENEAAGASMKPADNWNGARAPGLIGPPFTLASPWPTMFPAAS